MKIPFLKNILNRVALSGLCFSVFLGCSKVGQFKGQAATLNSAQDAQKAPGAVPGTPETPDVPPVVIPPPSYIPVALLWEKANVESKKWSSYIEMMFRSTVKDSLNAADDMIRFCPKFKSLNDDQKINTWGMLISAISKYESNFDPTSRMQETTMGTDPVTDLPVFSEGLLQLSYQDITGWSFCKFDWNKDKHLAPSDPNKTILNPFINLDCGVRILAEQVTRQHKIVLDRNVYWAVLKENGKYQKIAEIASLVKTLKFCQ